MKPAGVGAMPTAQRSYTLAVRTFLLALNDVIKVRVAHPTKKTYMTVQGYIKHSQKNLHLQYRQSRNAHLAQTHRR